MVSIMRRVHQTFGKWSCCSAIEFSDTTPKGQRKHKTRRPPPRLFAAYLVLGFVATGTALAFLGAHAEVLSPTPAWRSMPGHVTKSAALGDVDNDGDLDLVCGSSQTYLYINTGRVFSESPTWSIPEWGSAVALGDINGDGYLDLVRGDDRGWGLYLNVDGEFSSTPSDESFERATIIVLGDVNGDGALDLLTEVGLWLNQRGVFSQIVWYPDSVESVNRVALGDIDGDGDLDVVAAGNANAAVYTNDGGAFSDTPMFIDAGGMGDIALGDMDGDGDLDLVCSTGMYLNTGGVFSNTPAWRVGYCRAIALGDCDGDGDIDVAVGSNDSFGDKSVLFLNDGGVLAQNPAWTGVEGSFRFALLGDISGDGYLDLAVGSTGQGPLYLNEGRIFSNTPAWSVDQFSHCLALGDLNGDGDLDLVCSSSNVRLYPNEGGVFTHSPACSLTEFTYDLALGDIDRDGDIDMVCAGNDRVTEYLNNAGCFETMPAWSYFSGPHSVALGDVDNDGDLDVVYGGYYSGSELFLNEGVTFSSAPSWLSPGQVTEDVALKDVDRDGDLDLICGNYDTGSTLFLNNGGMFADTAAWRGERENTYDLALGDVNGDGYPDLVCGNYGISTLYLNNGSVFSAAPVWGSSAGDTKRIALRDTDDDGRLDLVCGNGVYLNEGGTFSSDLSWVPSDGLTIGSVTCGDVDNDGDLDLVCEEHDLSSNMIRVFLGVRNPVYHGDPMAPTNNLPNNSAFLKNARVTVAGKNLYTVRVTAFDVESDPILIVPEYQFEGVPRWFRADIAEGGTIVGPLETSPAGIEHELRWDVSRMPIDERNVVLRLRSISHPRRVGVIRHVTSFSAGLGRIDVRHPEIATSSEQLAFQTVTVGDTVSLNLSISNRGNEPLHVSRIVLPSSEMRIDQDAPFDLEAGQTVSMRISLEPRRETSIAGNLQIESDDPLNPVKVISVESDIRALQVQSRLLVSTQELALGEAVTVVVTPFPQVRVEGGYLYYRPEGGAEAFRDSISLAKYDDNYIATVPGAAVTEAGLEHYVRVENSGVFFTDPPGAPDDSVFYHPVTAPKLVTSAPQPNSGADFLENRDIKVQVSLPIGAEFAQGTLHVRYGGESAYRAVSLKAGDPLPFAVIGDSLAGPRGLQYWVEVQTLKATLTDPPNHPERSPHSIRVTVPDLVEQRWYAGKSYRMVSIPLDFDPEFTGTLEALLSDQKAFGPYDPVQWRTFRYLPASRKYAELSGATKEQFRPVPGRAFWLVSASKNRIGTGPIKGLSTATDRAYAIVLEPGWNMIGHPYAFPVPWDSVLVDSVVFGDAVGTIIDPPLRWAGAYSSNVTNLEPFEGYWVYNRTDRDIVMLVPAREAPAQSVPPVALTSSESEGWRLNLHAWAGAASDDFNFLGVLPGSIGGLDGNDRIDPPPPPGGLSLYFITQTQGKREESRRLTADIRAAAVSPTDWGEVWTFDIMKSFSREPAGDAVTITVDGIMSLPADAKAVLIDRTLDRQIALDEDVEYTFYLGTRDYVATEEDTRFRIIVGTESFVQEETTRSLELPGQAALYQNYPNPFNPSTIIRYDIAEPGMVDLRIYNVAGALVKVLETRHRERGRYEVGWNGENGRAEQVASGIYFYRMTAPGYSQTRKMVLVQ